MKLLDQVRHKCRLKHYSLSTERTYVSWIKQYIHYHNKKHPKLLGVSEIEAFLTYLAVKRHVSKSTQNQALSALLFLYKEILDIPIEGINAVRSKAKVRVPIVLSINEVNSIRGTQYLIMI